MARFNHLHKPFDNAKVRQAAIAAFRAGAVSARPGRRQGALQDLCEHVHLRHAVRQHGRQRPAGEVEHEEGAGPAEGVRLRRHAGRRHEADRSGGDQKLPDVAAQLLRQAGFKVDLQAMDWQTLVGRRAKKDAPDKGGWHMFLTAWQTYDVWSPIANPTMDTRGEKSGWFGWASDDKIMELRGQFMRATDEPTKKKLADQMHARAFEVATHVPLGE
jgi:peptide/nickel transport system substrate-binding protein